MFKFLPIFLTLFISVHAIEIVQKPITFNALRKTLTYQYVQKHYDINTTSMKIIPKIIVVHYTAINTLAGSFDAFSKVTLPTSRTDIASKKATVNVSVAYLVDKDGTIYQLMPDNWMGRHVIGLNYSSIGIENVGNLGTLTKEQREANVALIKYLQEKYASLEYLIGHSEYRCFENTSLWLEKDKGYRTHKEDPGEGFMRYIFKHLSGFKKAPCR